MKYIAFIQTKKYLCTNEKIFVVVQIIDRVTRQPVSGPELQGEICLKTAQLFPGYLGLDSEVLDPEGYFHTGDLGYYDKDGIIHFVEQVRWVQPDYCDT